MMMMNNFLINYSQVLNNYERKICNSMWIYIYENNILNKQF